MKHTDTQMLDWLEAHSHYGFGLVNDDNGHWAVSMAGMQNVPDGDGPHDIDTTFIVFKNEWKNSVREAIEAAMDEDETEEEPPRAQYEPSDEGEI